MKPKTYSAQILLVSLLVLMIIAIIVVGVVGVASRDVLQTSNNEEYQKVYNSAESSIFKLIDKYGDAAQGLNNLLSEPFTDGSCTHPGEYVCNFTDEGVATELKVNDSNVVTDYDLAKDDSFDMDLSGNYRGQIVMSWTGSTAMEFGLIYQDSTSTTKFIGDLYDVSGIFTASGNAPTVRTVPENHPFLFSKDAAGNIVFTIGNIVGLPTTASGAKTISLRVTARMASTQGATKLNVSGGSGFPNQVRIFKASSYDAASDVQTTAAVLTQLPLLPQAPAPFNYSLMTKGTVDKGLALTGP